MVLELAVFLEMNNIYFANALHSFYIFVLVCTN